MNTASNAVSFQDAAGIDAIDVHLTLDCTSIEKLDASLKKLETIAHMSMIILMKAGGNVSSAAQAVRVIVNTLAPGATKSCDAPPQAAPPRP